MGAFKKRGNRSGPAADQAHAEMGVLLLQGEDMVQQLAQAHASWGLGSAQRWDLDQRSGLITWTFPDKVATAPAQILASYNSEGESWLWAWANESILPELSRDACSLRDWAVAHNQPTLAQPAVHADDQAAAALTALAIRITEAEGFYRGSGGASVPIITFGPVTLSTPDGNLSTFKVSMS